MAITENTFTAEELTTAIKENPELEKVLKTLNAAGSLYVYNSEELETFLDGEKRKAIDETTSKIYNQIDQDVTTVTGGTKGGSEKTYDFIKRMMTEQKIKVTGLEKDIEKLSEQIKKGGDATLQAKYETLELEYKKAIEETIPGLNQKLFETKVSSLVESSTSDLKFNPAYDKSVIDTLIGVAKEKMLKAATLDGDKIIFKDETGKPFMNGIAVAGAKDVFLKLIPETAIDNGRQQLGGGTTSPGGTATKHKNPEGKEVIIPADVKTKVQLHEHLISQGLTSTSKEFIEIDAEYASLPVK